MRVSELQIALQIAQQIALQTDVDAHLLEGVVKTL